MSKIVLTGTTGNLGSAVLRHLLQLLPPYQVIVSVFNSNEESLETLKKTGVEVRHGDYIKPETLHSAFLGASKLFLVSSPHFDSAVRLKSHQNAIEAAIKVGVKHIVYTSFAVKMDSDQESVSEVAQVHLKTERMLKASALTYTIIREGTYIESHSIILDKEVVLPGDGKVPWVARDDLAEGSKSYTLRETVDLISAFLGRQIGFRLVSKEEWVTRLGGGGGPEILAKFYFGIERGELDTPNNNIGEINGRPMRSIEDRLRELIVAEDLALNETNNFLQHGSS